VKVETVNKPWGKEEILVKSNKYVMKRITITRGNRLSLQYHEIKEETIYVLQGNLVIWKTDNIDEKIVLEPGSLYHVKPNEIHRFGATDDEDAVILECSTPELWDVIRIKDDYNRK
tara:strand:+ start:160 stop:507 length:348 start_codon:yes stop_codon:yes gene_type:complete